MNEITNKHYALIPAKSKSSRCIDKNWRDFVLGENLVSYLISIIPEDFFDSVILSTDKPDVKNYDGVTIHFRNKTLATKESPVNDLIDVIIDEYELSNESCIWLLNPTSPFREPKDFINIKQMLEREDISSIISVSETNSFIWKDERPLFNTDYPRKNTQDFEVNYYIENGQFYVFRVVEFLKNKTWYSNSTFIYKQKGIKTCIDIDTEEDFLDAQKIAR